MPTSHLLWLYGRIQKEKLEERDDQMALVRVIVSAINPELARQLYKAQHDDADSDSVSISDEDFISSLKGINDSFKEEEYNRVASLLDE